MPIKHFISFMLILSSSLLAVAQEPHAIKSIYFGGGSYYVDEYQSVELSEFISEELKSGHYTITIHSHTDDIGGASYNEWLSEMRSQSIIKELTDNFIDPESKWVLNKYNFTTINIFLL